MCELLTPFEEFFEYTIQILKDIRVPEPHDVTSVTLQDLRPHRVMLLTLHVRFAIELDHQVEFMTVKVRDEVPERDLSAKLPSAELAVA